MFPDESRTTGTAPAVTPPQESLINNTFSLACPRLISTGLSRGVSPSGRVGRAPWADIGQTRALTVSSK